MYRLSQNVTRTTTIDVFDPARVHVVKSVRHKEPGRHDPTHPWTVVIADPHGLTAPWWIHYSSHGEAVAFAARFAIHTRNRRIAIERQYA